MKKCNNLRRTTHNSAKILVLADLYRAAPSNLLDHAFSFKKYSIFKCHYINPYGRQKPDWLHMEAYDVVVIHYSITCYHETYLSHSWRQALANCLSIKIQFIQDEYRYVNSIHKFLIECQIDILFTCIPEGEIEKVYPRKKLPQLTKLNTLTGFVPEYLESKREFSQSIRSIDVGYRARGVGFWWLGKLYQEKFLIGEQFKKLCKQENLILDISNREEDRLYGQAWLDFLKNCKATLGTESGASVIDWDGSLERRVKVAIEKNPEISFAEVSLKILKSQEGKVKMNQISPRIFEAIGCGTLLVLFEGKYSGIVEPWKHYVPLKKNFSNILEVVKIIKNEEKRWTIIERAFRDVVQSGKYSLRTFITQFDQIIEQSLKKKKSAKNDEATVSRFILPLIENNIPMADTPVTMIASASIRRRGKQMILSLPVLGNILGAVLNKIRLARSRYSIWKHNVFRYKLFWPEYPAMWLLAFTYKRSRKDV